MCEAIFSSSLLLLFCSNFYASKITTRENFNYLRTVQAFDSQQPYSYLNEIEYHDGLIYANVYLKSGHADNSNIVVIDPQTGAVKAEFNFAELKGKQGNPQAQ